MNRIMLERMNDKNAERMLENVKMLSPDDLDIVDQKRTLRQTIAELERDEDLAA